MVATPPVVASLVIQSELIGVDPRAPFGLGRHVEHDDASWDYRYQPRAAPVRSVLHRAGRVLDQGDLNACCGFAMAGLLDTSHFAHNRGCHGGPLTNVDAVALYSMATQLDEFTGDWPPTDTGSSGLGVVKAAKVFGYIGRYEHTFSFEAFTEAVAAQPVLVGTYWTETMSQVAASGLVTVGSLAKSAIVGGHEYLCRGINFEHKLLKFRNSWGASWGLRGDCLMTFADFQRLLDADGDVTVPIAA